MVLYSVAGVSSAVGAVQGSVSSWGGSSLAISLAASVALTVSEVVGKVSLLPCSSHPAKQERQSAITKRIAKVDFLIEKPPYSLYVYLTDL